MTYDQFYFYNKWKKEQDEKKAIRRRYEEALRERNLKLTSNKKGGKNV